MSSLVGPDGKELKSEVKKEEPATPEPNHDITKRIVPPHDKKSRLVTEADLDRVVEETKILFRLCYTPVGLYKAAHAMHHSQIDDKDPLNFFVLATQFIVINPVITRHTNTFVDSLEACMTFPDKEQIVVPRWHKIEVDYVTIMVDPDNKEKFKLSSVQHQHISGQSAFVFQHELDHGESKYIYQLVK